MLHVPAAIAARNAGNSEIAASVQFVAAGAVPLAFGYASLQNVPGKLFTPFVGNAAIAAAGAARERIDSRTERFSAFLDGPRAGCS
jgi:hypothetical protein